MIAAQLFCAQRIHPLPQRPALSRISGIDMDMERDPHIELLDGRLVINAVELLSRSRAKDGDIVVLSGTLLEGFGNLYSDLDLYVIGERLPKKAAGVPDTLVVREDGRVRRINETLAISTNILLDVQYYTFRELDTLARSLNTLYQESRQSTRIFRKTLHHEDEDLIHKLLTGKVLQDDTTGFDPRKTFDPERFCFLKYRNESAGYAEFRDLVGSWTAGDLDTCLYNMRSYLIAQVSGMMFLAGSTNPRPKWFVRRLAALGPTYRELRDGVMQWLSSAQSTEAQKRKAIETACELIDLTFSHSRRLLGTNPQYFSVEEALELTERQFAEHATQDRDAQAERQLLRRMFSDAESPMLAQLVGPSPRAMWVDTAYASAIERNGELR
jgi:hypothetical protein